MAARIRSPFFATAVLLITGAALGGVIVASYPSGPSDGSIPLVKAETTAYKDMPDDKGGMEIANRDTTVFSTMNDETAPEKPPVENLLESEQPVDKLAAFARDVDAQASSAPAQTMTPAPAQSQEPSAAAMMQKMETAPAASTPETASSPAPVQQALAIPEPVPPAGMEKTESPMPTIHKAGENPETLKFMKSALENQGQGTSGSSSSTPQEASRVASAPAPEVVIDPAPSQSTDLSISPTPIKKAPTESEAAAKVEPASGPRHVTAGSYYIQLGSVPSASGAAGEWGKLKTAFASQLQGLDYRVQKAELGAKGTFYRIQAGPMSKESAVDLCNAIKAQKPGGCLVAQ